MRTWRFHFTLKHKRAGTTCEVSVVGKDYAEAILGVDQAWKHIPGMKDHGVDGLMVILDKMEEII